MASTFGSVSRSLSVRVLHTSSYQTAKNGTTGKLKLASLPSMPCHTPSAVQDQQRLFVGMQRDAVWTVNYTLGEPKRKL